ncbi:hypothetical protein O6H91_06G045300 [Diphasiastrum complanatum]|uniref:Uncharacterized protein n=1 Tax=Diphasiastrum complanatum TaxID=34168 RepID=A0ACC2DD94_DIPCM|nr:hypothetical protein O6H91_06G045300 [Diphasiastrum complanatum]
MALLSCCKIHGNSDKTLELQDTEMERHVYKEPGRTWIEVNNKVHSFIVNASDHPSIMEIQAELHSLESRLKYLGYISATKCMPPVKSEEDKEVYPCHHSEKLAIAFGLISTPSNSPLRVFKNLRVCDDCHTFTKFVSKTLGRKLIVRDSTRFHHFKDGVCSCKDYW